MPIVKHIGVLSLGKIAALFGLVHGFVWGLFFTYFVEMVGLAIRRPVVAGLVGLGLFIAFIIAGGVIGFIWGSIVAFLYNVFSGWVGGIKIDVSDMKT
jgi:hypothetical protein